MSEEYYAEKKITLVVKTPVRPGNVIEAIKDKYWVSEEIIDQDESIIAIVEEKRE